MLEAVLLTASTSESEVERQTGPSLVDAAAGDPRASSCHDPDIDVRVTCQPFFPEREAVAVALAKPSTGNAMQAPRPAAKAERQREAQENARINVIL